MADRDACQWSYDRDYDYWDTECGKDFYLDGDTPWENDMRYCPFCGGKLWTIRLETIREADECN